MAFTKGIDVSVYQGNIAWSSVRAANEDYQFQ